MKTLFHVFLLILPGTYSSLVPFNTVPSLLPQSREKRQGFNRKDVEEGCKTTGYETRFRELCQEVVDRECEIVMNPKFRNEIQTRCDTRLMQQCNSTTRAVPREVCIPKNTTRCQVDIKLSEDTILRDECHNLVQHVCEEHYSVPVPVPVPVPTPVHVLKRGKKATPTPAAHSGYASPTPVAQGRYTSLTPVDHGGYASPTPATHGRYASPTPVDHGGYASPTPTTHGRYASPTPANHGGYASSTPSPQVRAPAVVVSALPRRRFKRQRQVLESSISASDQNTDLIRQLVVQLLRQRTGQTGLNQQTPQPQFNQLSQQTSFNQFDLQTPQGPPGMLTPGGLITTGLEEGRLGKALEQLTEQEEPVSPAQQAQILVDQLRQLVGSQTQAPILSPIPDSPPPPPPHSIHQAELPAPPGCRSVITQHCVKVPEKITLKVPEETCKEVPDVDCHIELEDVKEPLCDTVPIEECMDFLKEIPFLVAEEECKDVVRLECAEVEESVPIQVCTSIDINRDVIISSYGETYSVNGNRPLKSTSEVVAKIPIVSGVDGSERLSSKLRSGRAQNLDDSNNSESEDDSLDDSSERERDSRSRQRKNLSERRLKNFLSKLLDEDSKN